jgi:hypothetical protein
MRHLLLQKLTIACTTWFIEAKTESFVGFVLGIVAFEVEHVTLTLKSKNMGTDAVKEPSVVTDDNGATCKGLESLL